MTNAPTPCVTCGEPRTGTYCSHCGEKRTSSEDRTIRHIVGNVIESATNANGKALLTFRTLLRHPGRLTADHVRGRRKPYIAPLQLFLVANLIFFLLHPLIGSNTLTTTLNTHLHYTWHHTVAQSMVMPRLAARALTAEAYAAIFDPAAITHAKTLVILVVPIFSLAVMSFYGWRQRSYVVHLMFAAHVCTFWLLLICATLALTNLSIRLLRAVDVFPSAEHVSTAIIGVTLVIMAVYLFHATRAVFGQQAAWITAAKAIALGVAFDLSLQAYRCALFFITFWST
jgi:hypothetical protein